MGKFAYKYVYIVVMPILFLKADGILLCQLLTSILRATEEQN